MDSPLHPVHAKRHPIEMGPAEINRFLSALATSGT